MTILVRTSVKTYFTTGSRPTQSQFGDFIDSALFLAETTSQTIVGSIIVSGTTYAAGGFQSTTGSFSGLVSAGSLNVQGAISAGSMNLTGNISAASINTTGDILAATGRITASAATVSNQINAGNIQVTGIVSADAVHCSAVRSDNGVRFTNNIVSAAGTTQGTAALLTAPVCRVQGVTDGAATGVLLAANRGGVPSYVINQTALSANLWPPVGGTINALGANAAFGMLANTLYTVIPIAASAYYVK